MFRQTTEYLVCGQISMNEKLFMYRCRSHTNSSSALMAWGLGAVVSVFAPLRILSRRGLQATAINVSKSVRTRDSAATSRNSSLYTRDNKSPIATLLKELSCVSMLVGARVQMRKSSRSKC